MALMQHCEGSTEIDVTVQFGVEDDVAVACDIGYEGGGVAAACSSNGTLVHKKFSPCLRDVNTNFSISDDGSCSGSWEKISSETLCNEAISALMPNFNRSGNIATAIMTVAYEDKPLGCYFPGRGNANYELHLNPTYEPAYLSVDGAYLNSKGNINVSSPIDLAICTSICPTVPGGKCVMCASRKTCTKVICYSNFFDADIDASNGCEMEASTSDHGEEVAIDSLVPLGLFLLFCLVGYAMHARARTVHLKEQKESVGPAAIELSQFEKAGSVSPFPLPGGNEESGDEIVGEIKEDDAPGLPASHVAAFLQRHRRAIFTTRKSFIFFLHLLMLLCTLFTFWHIDDGGKLKDAIQQQVVEFEDDYISVYEASPARKIDDYFLVPLGGKCGADPITSEETDITDVNECIQAAKNIKLGDLTKINHLTAFNSALYRAGCILDKNEVLFIEGGGGDNALYADKVRYFCKNYNDYQESVVRQVLPSFDSIGNVDDAWKWMELLMPSIFWRDSWYDDTGFRTPGVPDLVDSDSFSAANIAQLGPLFSTMGYKAKFLGYMVIEQQRRGEDIELRESKKCFASAFDPLVGTCQASKLINSPDAQTYFSATEAEVNADVNVEVARTFQDVGWTQDYVWNQMVPLWRGFNVHQMAWLQYADGVFQT